ncbi:MAG TPA: alpha/beta hydrolase [Acetobacteraceae bacterium]|nr:alpha/beta hydrolase [Acetobacteraceae bacterium]
MKFSVREFAYRDALRARLFTPEGEGPFPAVVDIHGGAWCGGDLADGQARNEALAASGFVVAAINFRHGDDGYPTSLADINFAIRLLKARAAEWRVRADRIGLSGNSSGGHLAMLAAMRPGDPRYAALPLPSGLEPQDARVRCVALLWPVINPLSRYRYARRSRDSANPPAWVGDIPERHDRYWKNEAAMAEGNPMLALERGERVELLPAVWIQGRPDPTHDYRDPESPVPLNEPERFVANYRRAGGAIELVDIAQVDRAAACIAPLVAFFRRQLG